jgi:hypothetical protein
MGEGQGSLGLAGEEDLPKAVVVLLGVAVDLQEVFHQVHDPDLRDTSFGIQGELPAVVVQAGVGHLYEEENVLGLREALAVLF